MLYGSKSYAFQLGDVCFPTWGYMLSDLGIYAFQLGEVCFPTWGSMLSNSGKYAFRLEIHALEKV